MRLSILLAALESRPWNLIYGKLLQQQTAQVEILVEVDNGEATSGAKRQKLLDRATGDYIVYVDDDDDISDYYTSSILRCLEGNPDVLGINLLFFRNGIRRELWRFGDYVNNRARGKMCVNHLCPWRREIATKVAWCPELGNMDDHLWFQPLYHAPMRLRIARLDEAIYRYQYNDNITVNQDQTRKLYTKEYIKKGIRCFWSDNSNIYIEVPSNNKHTIKVRDCNNNLYEIRPDRFKHYHTVRQ